MKLISDLFISLENNKHVASFHFANTALWHETNVFKTWTTTDSKVMQQIMKKCELINDHEWI